MSLRRSQKSVQDLTLLGHEETKQNSNENNKPNSILSGKVSSTSKFAKKKGMCDECGIRSGAEDIHAYSEGRRRSPEEYATRVKNVSTS
uniref:Uncharacterized protein n=1 Tax=viral metagenome TaxID=1070528 RepID=A0A6C0HTT2_9ZZZZ